MHTNALKHARIKTFAQNKTRRAPALTKYAYHANGVIYDTAGMLITLIKWDCHSAVSNITPHY